MSWPSDNNFFSSKIIFSRSRVNFDSDAAIALCQTVLGLVVGVILRKKSPEECNSRCSIFRRQSVTRALSSRSNIPVCHNPLVNAAEVHNPTAADRKRRKAENSGLDSIG